MTMSLVDRLCRKLGASGPVSSTLPRWETSKSAAQVRARSYSVFFFQAEDGIRDRDVTGVQTCAFRSQPALTKALRKLEHELGGDLIHREGRLTQLTDLGKLVLPTLQRTVEAADTACKQAKRFRSEQLARLYIGLPPSISALLMVEPLSRLTSRI